MQRIPLFKIILLILSIECHCQISKPDSTLQSVADTLPAYPCTKEIPEKEGFTMCADGQEYHCKSFKAYYKNGRLFLAGSSPMGSTNVYPLLNIFVKTDGIKGLYKSSTKLSDVYGTLRDMGVGQYNSQTLNGFCTVEILDFDEVGVSGKFAMVGFSQQGNKAKLISGAFRLAFKKD
jgi:hypothetical protein